jgi:hypothetical protein
MPERPSDRSPIGGFLALVVGLPGCFDPGQGIVTTRAELVVLGEVLPAGGPEPVVGLVHLALVHGGEATTYCRRGR